MTITNAYFSLSRKINVWDHRFLPRWIFVSAFLGLMLCWVSLPLRGQCYQAKSLSGYHDLYPPAIEARACALADLVQVPAGAPPFKTFGYDLYPVLAYANPERSYGSQFQRLVEKHNQEQDYYLLIVKEFGQDGNISRYRLALKLPAGAPYDTLNAFTRSAITGQLQQIADEASDYNPKTNYLVEGEIMDALRRLLEGRNGLGDVMALAGFELIHIEQAFQVQVSENLDTDGPAVYDFSGLLNGAGLMRDLVAGNVAGGGFDPPVIIMTADKGANLIEKYQQAEQILNTSSAKVIAWIHFAIPDTGSVRVLKKVESNYSPDEAAALLDELYTAHMANYYAQVEAADLLKDAEPPIIALPHDPVRSASVNCDGDACQFPSVATLIKETIFDKEQFFKRVQAYSFYCCELVPFKCDGIFSKVFPQLVGQTVLGSYECLQLDYGAGITYGVLDGLKGTLAFVYDLIYLTGKHIPILPEFWADLGRKVWKEGLVGGFKSKFRDDAEFVYRLGKTLYTAFDNLGTIVKTVLTELRDAVENALFFNGPKYAGYAHGKIVFDAILTTITGGTSLAQSIAVKGLSVFRSLGDDLAVTIKKGVALFAVRKVDDVLLAQLNKLSYGAVTGNYKTFVANNLDNLIINWPTIWAMPSFTNRGKLIEEILALTYYKGFINIGQLKGGTQTLVDFILDPNGLLIQLKSTNAKSVKNIISDFKEVIDKLADLQKSKTFISGDGRNFIVNMARFDICLPKELFNNNKALFDELNNYVSRHTVAVIDINYIKK